jgi:predicted Na+-dependent transporter
MTASLAWIGRRAHWLLALSILVCFLLPAASGLLRPLLPILVALVLGLAMARVDLGVELRAVLRPRRLAVLVGLALLLMPVSGGLYLAAGRALGLDADLLAALVYLAAAPPISSAANLCFILGLNARRALEVSVVATLLTPLLGPLTVELFQPGGAALPARELAFNLGTMVAGGIALGVVIRWLVGPARIEREAHVFDGVAALALIALVIPLFYGVPHIIAAEPGRAALVLFVALVVDFGLFFLLRALLARRLAPADAGTYALLFSSRTVALYAAALPHDPRFALFVALYQVPILTTALVLRAFPGRGQRLTARNDKPKTP